MPDIARKTISATEAPALWNVSPYLTRWMLFKRFRDGMNVDSEPDERMSWGTKMEPLLLEQASQDLKMEVIPNKGERTYVRRGLLGCTRDAIVICPDRGPGTLETKCVFDYRTWMDKWQGGEAPPRHYEIQTQVQMQVGNPDGEPYKWGVIAAWLGGEMHYFERQPIPELWTALETEAAQFMADVAAGKEPDPFGHPIEIPALSLIERVAEKAITVDDAELAQLARAYAEAGDIVSAGNKRRDEIKARLLAVAGDAEIVRLPGGVSVKVRRQTRGAYEVKESTFAVVKVHVPNEGVE